MILGGLKAQREAKRTAAVEELLKVRRLAPHIELLDHTPVEVRFTRHVRAHVVVGRCAHHVGGRVTQRDFVRGRLRVVLHSTKSGKSELLFREGSQYRMLGKVRGTSCVYVRMSMCVHTKAGSKNRRAHHVHTTKPSEECIAPSIRVNDFRKIPRSVLQWDRY